MLMRKWGILSGGLVLVLPCFSFGAAETLLHKVNTSVGVKPTSVKKKWILETDPTVTSAATVAPDPTVSQYIPVEGLLNNHFDPTQFQLNTNATSGKFTLGDSVAGEGAYQVLGFKVQTIDGGLIDVEDNGTGGDAYTNVTSGTLDPTNGPVGGGETGNVYDIHFKIITDRASQALSADQDQNFYELFLNQIGATPPGMGTTYVTADSYLTVAPSDSSSALQAYTITSDAINGSSVPEVSGASMIGLGALMLLARRRPAFAETEIAGAS